MMVFTRHLSLRHIAIWSLILAAMPVSGCLGDEEVDQRARYPSQSQAAGEPASTGGTTPPTSSPTTTPDELPVSEPGLTTDFSPSKGSGGRSGSFSEAFTDSHSLTSEYFMKVPAVGGQERPIGLFVFIHGDSNALLNINALKLMFAGLAEGASDGLIELAVLAPNKTKWWGPDGDDHARYLKELIHSKVYEKYNIDRSRVVFAGMSGGSNFLSRNLLADHGYGFKGGAILLCGGIPPALVKHEDRVRQQMKIYVETATGDFLFEQSKDTADYFENRKYSIESKFPVGSGHCFNMQLKSLYQAYVQAFQ